jgi:CMP-N,N'-diacetyllegionaminic acid synthase
MLAIIPARGGSKGVPGKNIKLLCGKPLIAHTIETATAAKSIDRIVLSTDDPEIAEIAGKYGVDIPFLRPKELAQDDSKAIDNYIYTIERLNTEFNGDYKEFIVLLPTSPLRNHEDIDKAVELFCDNNADSVISCVEMPHPPHWAKKINEEGKIQNYFSVVIDNNKNRQEFEPAYIPNGSIFIFRYSLLKEQYTYYSENTYAYVMPKERSVDIDSLFDFRIVEYMMSIR